MAKYIGFDKLKEKIAKQSGSKDAGAIAASIGIRKYGKTSMEKAAKAGSKMKDVKPKGK